jgi:hypothetical protein
MISWWGGVWVFPGLRLGCSVVRVSIICTYLQLKRRLRERERERERERMFNLKYNVKSYMF